MTSVTSSTGKRAPVAGENETFDDVQLICTLLEFVCFVYSVLSCGKDNHRLIDRCCSHVTPHK